MRKVRAILVRREREIVHGSQRGLSADDPMLRSVQVDLDAIAHPQFAATSRLGFPIDMHAPVVHDGLCFSRSDARGVKPQRWRNGGWRYRTRGG